MRDRLTVLGEDVEAFRVEWAASRLAWPCPRCARMRWRSRVVAEVTDGRELLARNAKTGTSAKIRVSLN